jgi:hypothetical protein
VSDPLAPIASSCLYGDDLITRDDIGYIFTFPTTYLTCKDAISYMKANNIDYLSFCKSSGYTFGTKCCKSCESKDIDP